MRVVKHEPSHHVGLEKAFSQKGGSKQYYIDNQQILGKDRDILHKASAPFSSIAGIITHCLEFVFYFVYANYGNYLPSARCQFGVLAGK